MTCDSLASTCLEKWTRFAQNVERPVACVFCCHPRVWLNGWRYRSASVWHNEQVVHVVDIPCRRTKCASCKQSWVLRPPEVCTRRHYQPCVISAALSQYLFDSKASYPSVAIRFGSTCRTIGRWLQSITTCVEPSSLVRQLVFILNVPIVPAVLPVRSMERKGRSLAKQKLLTQVAEVLGCLEAWAQALGLEPPGLRAWSQATSIPPCTDLSHVLHSPTMPKDNLR